MRHIFTWIVMLLVPSLNAQKSKQVQQPRDIVIQLFVATDNQEWNIVKNCFSKQVVLDYSSMGHPIATLSPKQITDSWKSILLGFSHTHHQIGNLQQTLSKQKAEVFAYGTATHFLEDDKGNLWTVVGSYNFSLVKENTQWKITKMAFNFKYQDGNTILPQKAMKKIKEKNNTKTTQMKKVQFKSEGFNLTGHLYLPKNYNTKSKWPAIIVSGSWTTVKEQMAGLYAQKLAEEGFVTLAFDFRNFGESEGQPRFFESPELKKTDIKNAMTYLSKLPQVNKEQIGVFGVCAGAMYSLMASAEDNRIKSVVTVASWLHDAEAVKLFYGGEDGVKAKIAAAKAAKQTYAKTGDIAYIPTISETDDTAAMYGPYDYYLNAQRGAIKQWSNDKFAVASWEDWLTANPMPYAKSIHQPTLMIHSDGAVLPNYTKQFFSDIATNDKKLHWMETKLDSPYHQFNYYDQETEVNESITEASKWFKSKM